VNDLNTTLQRKGRLVCDMVSDVKSFQLKLKLFTKQLNEGNLYHFPCCNSISQEGNIKIPCKSFSECLRDVAEGISGKILRFSGILQRYSLLSEPFHL
jgi:hypothetical protein